MMSAAVRAFLVVAGCVAGGGACGLGLAWLALAFAEGDGRGGPFLVIGFALLLGLVAGLLVGAVWAARLLRRGSRPPA